MSCSVVNIRTVRKSYVLLWPRMPSNGRVVPFMAGCGRVGGRFLDGSGRIVPVMVSRYGSSG